MYRIFCIFVALLLAAPIADGRGIYPDASLVRRANRWKPGQPIPAELLRYRDSTANFSPLIVAHPSPADTDSKVVFGGITNYPLLKEIVFAPCDKKVFDLAVDNALLTGGLARFYHEADERYRAHPEMLSAPRHQRLCRRARQRQAIVGTMYAKDENLPKDAAAAAFANCAANLRAGMAFEQAATKCQATYLQGSKNDLSLIAVGVEELLERPKLHGLFHDNSIPDADARRLLSSRSGATFTVREKDATQFYWTREVYVPPKHYPGKP